MRICHNFEIWGLLYLLSFTSHAVVHPWSMVICQISPKLVFSVAHERQKALIVTIFSIWLFSVFSVTFYLLPVTCGTAIEQIHTILASPKYFDIWRIVLMLGDAENFGKNTLLTLNPHNCTHNYKVPWVNPPNFNSEENIKQALRSTNAENIVGVYIPTLGEIFNF